MRSNQMAGASVYGMPLLPPTMSAVAAAAMATATNTATATATGGLGLLLLVLLLGGLGLVIAGAAVGVRRVLLPYIRARHPDTGYIPGNEAGHLLQHTCNVPVIHAFLVVQGTLTKEHVVKVLHDAGVPHRRFQRLAQCISSRPDAHEPFEPSRGDWPAYWQPERDFSLKHHVRHLPKGMDHASLTAYLGSVINTPPPFDRSPWECVLASGFAGRDSTAVVVRLHHVLGDGLSLMGLLDAITQPLHEKHAGSSSLDAALRVGIKTPQSHPYSSSFSSLAALGALARRWLRLAGLGLRMCMELPWVVRRDFVAPPPETNVFRPPAPLSGRKAVGYRLAALDVPRCRRVKDALGVKLNDVLLACAAGALRRMHGHIHDSMHGAGMAGKGEGGWGDVIPDEEEEEEELKEPTTRTTQQRRQQSASSAPLPPRPAPPDTVRFFAPMSCRTNLRKLTDLDNQLSVLSIPLPVGPPCRLVRLRRVHAFMARLKASTVPLGMALLTQASGHMPRAVLEFQADYFCSKATGVLTNVPGPSHARTLHGKPIEEFIFFVPAVSSLSMVLSTLTYAGRLSVGLVVDESVPAFKCDDFLAFFLQEFEAYEAHVLGTQAQTEAQTKTAGPANDKVKSA